MICICVFWVFGFWCRAWGEWFLWDFGVLGGFAEFSCVVMSFVGLWVWFWFVCWFALVMVCVFWFIRLILGFYFACLGCCFELGFGLRCCGWFAGFVFLRGFWVLNLWFVCWLPCGFPLAFRCFYVVLAIGLG